jgi:hypothetical protein
VKQIVLKANGYQHALPLVLAKAGSCPLVEFNVDELDIGTLFEFVPYDSVIGGLNLVVYKHAGKFLIVVGADHVAKAIENGQKKISGRLLTSVALKNARLTEAQPQSIQPPAPPFNPPRFTDKRTLGDRFQSPPPFNSNRGQNTQQRQSFGKPSQPKKRFA